MISVKIITILSITLNWFNNLSSDEVIVTDKRIDIEVTQNNDINDHNKDNIINNDLKETNNNNTISNKNNNDDSKIPKYKELIYTPLF
jgi:hypothetical protein